MKWDAKKRLLIEYIADPADTRTYREKAAAAGVPKTTMYRMLKEPEALKLLRERTDHYIAQYRPEAYACLVRNFRSGDRASARDYLQALGDIGTGGHTSNVYVKQETGKSEPGFDERLAEQLAIRQDALTQDEG